MIYIHIFVNIVLLLLFDYMCLSFSLISGQDLLTGLYVSFGKYLSAYAPFGNVKPCREQQKASRCFHADTCTASFHSNKSNITFIKS